MPNSKSQKELDGFEPKEFAEKVKNLMEFYGYNQVELAKKTGISQNYISYILKGKHKNLGVDILYKLAQVFNLTIDSLIKEKTSFHRSLIPMRLGVEMSEQDLTKEDLAIKAGINPDQIHSILSGRSTNLTFDVMSKLASALEISVSELIGRKEFKNIIDVDLLPFSLDTRSGKYIHELYKLYESSEYANAPNDNRASFKFTMSRERIFGLYVEGDAFSPMLKEGDLVLISPDKEFRPGNLCFVMISNTKASKESNRGYGFLRYVDIEDENIILSFGPFKRIGEIQFKKEEIEFIHPVVGIIFGAIPPGDQD